MKVKVIGATLGSYWYADKLGQVFDVVDYSNPNQPTFAYHVKDCKEGNLFNKNDVEIINEEKVMKKSDLRTGMRVVHGKHPRQEGYAIVVCDLDKIFFKSGGWNSLQTYNDDLTGSCSSWDITEVYDVPDYSVLNFEVAGELLWRRETKSAEQIQLDVLQEKIVELTREAEKLQKLVQK